MYLRSVQVYYASALDHIEIVLSSNGLQSIQGILCCAVYSIRSPVGVSLWYEVNPQAHCSSRGFYVDAVTVTGKFPGWRFDTASSWATTAAPICITGTQIR